MSCMSVHPYSLGPVSWSDVTNCFGTSSWARMLVSAHFMQSQVCPLSAVPQSTPGSPRSLVCAAGNGPHHHGPCRYAYATQPAPYPKDDLLEVQVTGPPTTHHCRLPTRGAQDGENPPCLAGPRHRACRSSRARATGSQRQSISYVMTIFSSALCRFLTWE